MRYSQRVRLLPTLVGAIAVLLCLRIGAMAANKDADTSSEETKSEAQTDEGSSAKSEEPKDGGANVASEGNATAPAEAPASEQNNGESSHENANSSTGPTQPQTKGEAEVLQQLSERRAALETRERDLGLREQLLLAAEKQVDARLAALKELETKLDVMMAKRNEQEEAQIASLVKSYETMKPEDAARIFNRLERNILVDVSSRMKPAKIGAILAAMEPARAQDLTVLLAKRLKLSQSLPSSQNALPNLAVPPPAAAAEAPINGDEVGADAEAPSGGPSG